MTDEPAVRTRRRALLLAGPAVAALAVLGWGLAERTDPRDMVVAYTDAIAAGDVTAANALATDGGGGPVPGCPGPGRWTTPSPSRGSGSARTAATPRCPR